MPRAEENIQRDTTEKNDEYLFIRDTTVTHVHVGNAQRQWNEDQGSRNVLGNGHSHSPVSGVYAGTGISIGEEGRGVRAKPPFFIIVLGAGLGGVSETGQKGG